LPGDDGREQHKHRDEQSEAKKEIPIRAVGPIDVEVNGLHGLHQRIHTPRRIDLAESYCVPYSEQHQKNRGNAVQQ
jgi:hypothetical protein